MKFKYLNEGADSDFDLYPVIKDVTKLGKEFQREGEIEWVNGSGQHFRTYHDGKLHRFTKEPFDLYMVMDDDEEKYISNKKKYTVHFPDGLKEPKA